MGSSNETTSVHLVLSAGGVKAISYVGGLSVLEQRNITLATVSACSAGSFIGGLLCAGKRPAEIESWVSHFDLAAFAGKREYPGLLRYLSYLKWPFAEYQEAGFPKLFCELVGGNPRFKDLQIPFATAGVDIVSDRILVYSSQTHPEMFVSEAMRIATALPLMYPPHKNKGRIVVDAVVASRSPVWLATAYEDDRPILVFKPTTPVDLYEPGNLFNYLSEIFLTSVGSRDDYIMKQIPRVRVIEIDCGSLRSTQFKLSEDEKNFLLARGRTCTEDALNLWGDDLSRVQVAAPVLATGDEVIVGEDDVAERAGANLLNSFHQKLSNMVRAHVFISYSHKDKKYLELLQTHLKPYVRNASVTVWDDTQIKSGSQWASAINRALESARVAVLLVSPNFLESDFIANHELPRLIEAAEQGKLTILWIPISYSAYKQTALEKIQAARDCNPEQPLDTLPEAEINRIFVKVCEQIEALMSVG